MKLASLLLLIIGGLGLMNGRVDATTSSPASSQQASSESGATTARDDSTGLSRGSSTRNAEDRKSEKNEKRSDNLRGLHDVPKKDLGHSPAKLTAIDRLSHPNYQRPGSATAIGFRQPGSNRSGGVEGKRLIENETARDALPVRPPSAIRSSAATLTNVRHRGPNPPAIGGLSNSPISSTGSIDGNRVRHRR